MIVKITTSVSKNIHTLNIHLSKGGILKFEYKGNLFEEFKERFFRKYHLIKITKDNEDELKENINLFSVEYRVKKSQLPTTYRGGCLLALYDKH
jgi:hypothetical protein